MIALFALGLCVGALWALLAVVTAVVVIASVIGTHDYDRDGS